MKKNVLCSREDYKKIFQKLMRKSNYVLEEGEEFKQCKEPYPPYWFVSNQGYVLSVYRNKIKRITHSIKRTGKKGKNGERPRRDWFYRYSVNGKKANVTEHKLVADHFLEDEFTGDTSGEIHHIRPQSSFADNEGMKCNRADNLQKLPPDVHSVVTRLSRKTPEQIEEAWDRKAKKDNAKIIELSSEQLTKVAISIANQLLGQQGWQGMIAIEGKSEQEMSAYPIKGMSTRGNADGTESYRLISPKEYDRLLGKDSPLAGEQKEV